MISTLGPAARMLTTRQLSAFLKSDQAKAAPSERTALEATDVLKQIKDTMEMAQATQRLQSHKAGQISGAGVVLATLVPFTFCTSVGYISYCPRYGSVLTRNPISISA